MEKIIITATADSRKQVSQLLSLGVDRILIGEEKYGLRLPHHFSQEEMTDIVNEVHAVGKELVVATNALMHQDMMNDLPKYLDFLQNIGVDYITVGDAGVFYVIKRDNYQLKTIYDASTMVTSSRQINFWKKNAGISEAVLAREIPAEELFIMAGNLEVPAEILVYGASVIHQSKRPLLENYYHFTKMDEEKGRERDLFLSEPNDSDSHYSIFEDRHGTHIFANNDLDLMSKLVELTDHGYTHWKLDGLYTKGDDFLAIVAAFIEAKTLLEKGELTAAKALFLDEIVHKHHPKTRGLSRGFYDYTPDMVK